MTEIPARDRDANLTLLLDRMAQDPAPRTMGRVVNIDVIFVQRSIRISLEALLRVSQ